MSMTKTQAIALLGGTATAAAAAMGISSPALSKWPEVLTAKLSDRVEAALWRAEQARLAAEREAAASRAGGVRQVERRGQLRRAEDRALQADGGATPVAELLVAVDRRQKNRAGGGRRDGLAPTPGRRASDRAAATPTT